MHIRNLVKACVGLKRSGFCFIKSILTDVEKSEAVIRITVRRRSLDGGFKDGLRILESFLRRVNLGKIQRDIDRAAKLERMPERSLGVAESSRFPVTVSLIIKGRSLFPRGFRKQALVQRYNGRAALHPIHGSAEFNIE